MGLIGILLLVVFVIVAVLLVLIVLVQNEEGDSLGGIFAGGSSSAFGSRSGNVLTKTTSILGALFLLSSFGLAMINRTAGDSGVEAAAQTIQAGAATTEWWANSPDSSAAPAPAPATEPVPAETTSETK
jgi:preprotein translocase subunit SecG